MIQYIYFVKCPDCEDEPFDFFDEAKTYALGCLSAKPIITQVEVDRDDFGCCTDSCDLGTIWSYEDALGNDCGSEDDNKLSTFTKSETFEISDEDFSKEFEDNEISKVLDDLIKDEYEAIDGYESAEDLIKQYDLASEDKDTILSTLDHIKAEEEEHIDELEELPHKNTKSGIAEDSEKFCKRKLIPEGMTVKDIVEVMEENEDTVECTWCEDLFDKSECRYEVDLGWLCPRCEAAIKSRGEPLTFRENNYWDFLEEENTAKNIVWICVFDGDEIGTVTAKTEEEAIEKMQHEYPEYPYGIYDGCFDVFPEEDDRLTEAHEFNNFSKLEPNELTKAKSDILLDLYCDADAGDFVNLQTESLSVPFIVDSYSPVTYKKSGTKCVGTIVDFNIVGNKVIFKLESGMELSLQDIFTAASKDSKTRKFLDAFEFVVKKINKASRVLPSVLFERDIIKALEKDSIFAETFAKYITDITFTVPLINVPPYDADFYGTVFADGVELDSDEGDAARKCIENLCDKFMSKPYATSAIEKNKVINRTIKSSDKSYHVNPKSWGNSGTITLSCSIKTLEDEAPGIKNLINNSKTIKDNSNVRDVQDNDTTIKNFNLASALIQYFDNDVEFYKKSRLPLTASLTHNKKVSELTESLSSITGTVELEYRDFGDPYGPNTYIYEADRDEVIEYLCDQVLNKLPDEEVQKLLNLSKPPYECDDEEYFQAVDDNFDEVFDKFEDEIYDYFRDDCEEEYYSQDWEEIAYEQAMEFQWECDTDR